MNGEVFGGMFNSCTIQSFQILFGPGSVPPDAGQ